MSHKIPVAVIAATGAVGQRFVGLLEDHPWFEVAVVTASERSEGKRYAEAVNWVVPGEIPASVRDLIVQETSLEALGEVGVVFSALPSDAARAFEPLAAGAGYRVCTNASAFRMTEDVPLLIPEINPDHVHLIDAQRQKRGWEGLIVASPNCSTTGIIFPLAALHRAIGLKQAHAVTMQAISGAGWPGVSSFDILDNIIPHIGGEEEKVETEPLKMLGRLAGDHIDYAQIDISAQTNRVPVMDGHFAAVSVSLARAASLEAIQQAIRDFQGPDDVRALPSAPDRLMILRDEPDRPQPRRDRDAGGGMAISVGRVQPCNVLDVKFVSLVHNTIRGAAGGAILNAEWLVKTGYIGETEKNLAHAGD